MPRPRVIRDTKLGLFLGIRQFCSLDSLDKNPEHQMIQVFILINK
jgi:hypothetical protein